MRSGANQSEDRAREEIAATIAPIWADSLGRTHVDEHSDFFSGGGDHFIAPVMINRINEALGLDLTPRDLEQGRTVARLTDLIHFKRNQVDHSTVVPLRNLRGTRPPLFIVHGVGGNVLGFYALAKGMDPDQPVYGIQAQALVPGRDAVLRLEEMAVQYVEDMRAVCPHGPYHLLGLSYGGLVAYEIAQQLTAEGLEVGLLGMLDTRQPQGMRGLPGRGRLHRRLFWRMKLIYIHTRRRNGRMSYLLRRLSERLQRIGYMYAHKGPGLVASAVRNVREINYVAGVNYVVQPYSGRVTVFRAEDDAHEEALPPDLYWGQFARGGIIVKELAGDHVRILYEPWLSMLVQALSEALEEANASLLAVPVRSSRRKRVMIEI
jgi:thioesterase domain-containing protein